MPFSSKPTTPITNTASGWCAASWWSIWMSVWTASTSSEKHSAARKMHTISMVRMSMRVQPNVLRSECSCSCWWAVCASWQSPISPKLPCDADFLVVRGGVHGRGVVDGLALCCERRKTRSSWCWRWEFVYVMECDYWAPTLMVMMQPVSAMMLHSMW